MPPFNGGDDLVWVLGPAEGARVVVGLAQESIDCGLKLDDGAEHTTFEPPLEIELAKKPSIALSHEADVGVKWNVQRGCRASQARTAGCLCVCIVVGDGVDQFGRRDTGTDGVEEPNKLLMPVTLHAAPDHHAVQHVEGGEQGRGAVALVVVVIVPQRPFFMGRHG